MVELNSFSNIDPDVNLELGTQRCEYYTLNEYNNLILDTEQNFKLLNFNVRSFHSNHDSFAALLDTLPSLPEAVVLTETWNTAENLSMCTLENYDGNHTYRITGRGGGVSVFCHSAGTCNKIPTMCLCSENIETCAVECVYQEFQLIVLGVYRPPAGSPEDFV